MCLASLILLSIDPAEKSFQPVVHCFPTVARCGLRFISKFRFEVALQRYVLVMTRMAALGGREGRLYEQHAPYATFQNSPAIFRRMAEIGVWRWGHLYGHVPHIYAVSNFRFFLWRRRAAEVGGAGAGGWNEERRLVFKLRKAEISIIQPILEIFVFVFSSNPDVSKALSLVRPTLGPFCQQLVRAWRYSYLRRLGQEVRKACHSCV